MTILPINLFKIGFKGNAAQQLPISKDNSEPKNDANQTPQVQSNPIAAELNVKTPISYKKIADIKVNGIDKPAPMYKLANGQKVVILPKNGPVVVKTYFNVGSMNEPDHLRGISHFIEHNLFNGSKDLKPGEFFEKVSELGAYTNASTGYDQTNYYIESNLLKDDYLEKMIKLHADQIQNPTFPEDMIEKERGPVTSEICMYADNPSNTGINLMLKNLFNIKSESPDLIAGTVKNINAITKQDVLDYYNTWYTPDNSVTVITGDVEPEKTMELASKYLTKNTLATNSNRKYEALIPTEKPIRTDIKSPNTQEDIINLGFAGPPTNNTKDKIATEVIIMLLTGYNNAKLTKALEPYQLGADFGLEKIGNKSDDQKALILTASSPEAKSELALKIIFDEISKFTQTPPSEEDLNMIKEKLKMSIAESNESSENLNCLIGSKLLDNDTSYLSSYREILDSLTPQDIMDAAKKYLDLNKTSIVVVHPEKTDNQSIIQNYNNTNGIKQGTKNVAFGNSQVQAHSDFYSKVKQYRLKNNMEIAVNPIQADFASYKIDFMAKEFKNLSSVELSILDQMLNRGSMSKDNTTFNDITSKNNISLGFGVSNEGISAYSKSPTGNFSKALDLSKEVILNPRFTQEDFDWAKQSTKEALLGLSKDANDKLNASLLPNLKMTQTPEEELKQLDSISLNDIINDYNSIMADIQATAVLSAPVDKNPELFNQFATSLSTDLPVFAKYTPSLPKTYISNEKSETLTTAEQRQQAQVVKGYKFQYSGNIDDKAKLLVMNSILGGTSTSRLFQDLRESQKLAYYVASKFNTIGDTGIIKLNILTTTDDKGNPLSSPLNIQKSLDGFDKHINKLKTEPVTAEELEKTKLTLKNNILSGIETSSDQSQDLIAGKESYYGIERSKKLLEAIEKVTAEDVMTAANYAFKNPPVTSVLASEETIKANNL